MVDANQPGRTGQLASGFAALGDPTRLALLTTLTDGQARSITALTEGFKLSRQAISKHLRILEAEQLLACQRVGREMRFALRPERLNDLESFLQAVSHQWDLRLERLRDHVEG
ncbi:MAG: metalloregulator ArsR/SmtB family transcription factor [Pseudomonadota bacterium]